MGVIFAHRPRPTATETGELQPDGKGRLLECLRSLLLVLDGLTPIPHGCTPSVALEELVDDIHRARTITPL